MKPKGTEGYSVNTFIETGQTKTQSVSLFGPSSRPPKLNNLLIIVCFPLCERFEGRVCVCVCVCVCAHVCVRVCECVLVC